MIKNARCINLLIIVIPHKSYYLVEQHFSLFTTCWQMWIQNLKFMGSYNDLKLIYDKIEFTVKYL